MTFSFLKKIFTTSLTDKISTIFHLPSWSKDKLEENPFSLNLKLKNKLLTLKNSLENFNFPKSFISSGYLTKQNTNYAKASLETTPKPYFRLISSGYPKDKIVPFTPKTYEFTVYLGENKQTLEVEVEEGETYFSLLQKLESLFNNSSLNVQAKIITQNLPRQKAPTPNTQTFLAILTPYEFSTTPLKIKEKQGFLLKQLNLKEPLPYFPSIKGSYAFTDPKLFSPSTFHSFGFDPNSYINWDIGHYDFQVNLDNSSFTVYLAKVDKQALRQLQLLAANTNTLVKDTSNWENIVQNLGFSTTNVTSNTTWKSLKTSLKDYLIFTEDTTYEQALKKIGFKLKELSEQKIDFSLETHPGYYFLEKTYPVEYNYLKLNLVNPKLGMRLYFSDGTNSPLEKLGLQATSKPGIDTQVKINGTTFTLPSLNATLKKGELSLKLVKPQSGNIFFEILKGDSLISEQMQEIVNKYNKLILFINDNLEVLNHNLKKKLTIPFKKANLSSIGIKLNLDNTLKLDKENFQIQLSLNPENLQEILLGTNGVLSTLQKNIEDILTNLNGYLDLKKLNQNSKFSSLLTQKEIASTLLKKKI